MNILLQQACLRSRGDVVKELKPYKIHKDYNDVKTIIEELIFNIKPNIRWNARKVTINNIIFIYIISLLKIGILKIIDLYVYATG